MFFEIVDDDVFVHESSNTDVRNATGLVFEVIDDEVSDQQGTVSSEDRQVVRLCDDAGGEVTEAACSRNAVGKDAHVSATGYRERLKNVPNSAELLQGMRREAQAWHPPAKLQASAMLQVQSILPKLLSAFASHEWTEFHTSGLLGGSDLSLPPGSPELCEKLKLRLLNTALGQLLQESGDLAGACNAFARAALSTDRWVEVYFQWSECLQRDGRIDDARAVHQLAVEKGVWGHHLQRPNDLYVLGLRAKPFWQAAEIPAAKELEKAFPTILKEYHALRCAAQNGFWTPITDKPLVFQGNWTDFKLIENGKRHPVNCARCPETLKMILQNCPEIATQVRGSLIFSRLEGGTTIKPHCGPTNTRIRIHLGLEVPTSTGETKPQIRVGHEWRAWEEGRCLVFDDSFEHEVVHAGSHPRVVLIADLWHPDFTAELQRKYLHGRHRRRWLQALQLDETKFEHHPVDAVEVRFLEDVLRQVHGVQEAVTTMHSDKQGRQILIAYVQVASMHAGGGPEVDMACDRCAERLKAYDVDSLVLAILEWPRMADGVIDRKKLPPPPAALLAEATGD